MAEEQWTSIGIASAVQLFSLARNNIKWAYSQYSKFEEALWDNEAAINEKVKENIVIKPGISDEVYNLSNHYKRAKSAHRIGHHGI